MSFEGIIVLSPWCALTHTAAVQEAAFACGSTVIQSTIRLKAACPVSAAALPPLACVSDFGYVLNHILSSLLYFHALHLILWRTDLCGIVLPFCTWHHLFFIVVYMWYTKNKEKDITDSYRLRFEQQLLTKHNSITYCPI